MGGAGVVPQRALGYYVGDVQGAFTVHGKAFVLRVMFIRVSANMFVCMC